MTDSAILWQVTDLVDEDTHRPDSAWCCIQGWMQPTVDVEAPVSRTLLANIPTPLPPATPTPVGLVPHTNSIEPNLADEVSMLVECLVAFLGAPALVLLPVLEERLHAELMTTTPPHAEKRETPLVSNDAQKPLQAHKPPGCNDARFMALVLLAPIDYHLAGGVLEEVGLDDGPLGEGGEERADEVTQVHRLPTQHPYQSDPGTLASSGSSAPQDVCTANNAVLHTPEATQLSRGSQSRVA
jgi:hypothetical protein